MSCLPGQEKRGRRRCRAWNLGPDIASATLAEWRVRLVSMKGVRAPVQAPLEMHADPQVAANGYIQPVTSENGVVVCLPTSPVQFDMTPPAVRGGPGHGEHTDEVLLELGLAQDDLIGLKMNGSVL